jgi:glutathione S-transferase
MILYDLPVSSFGAKIRAVLALKGLAAERRTPPEGYGSAAYRAIVPTGKIPALVLDDGAVLMESSAIAEWLEEAFPQPALLPGDARARARIRALAAYADTALDPPLRACFAAPPPEAAAPNLERFVARLPIWEALLDAEGPFAAGAAPTLADSYPPFVALMAEAILPAYAYAFTPGPRWARAQHAAATHPALGPVIAGYRAAVTEWAAARYALVRTPGRSPTSG